MKLSELLETLSYDQLIGIWNIDNKREKQPQPQNYSKVGNLPYRKIRNVLDYEILAINVVGKNGGLLVRVYDRERLRRSLDHHDLAREIKEVSIL